MACSACHYQHFPVLNQFGRAFKEGGYTMVGAQDKIEGDDISLPVVLNAALVGYVSYSKPMVKQLLQLLEARVPTTVRCRYRNRSACSWVVAPGTYRFRS